MESGLWPACGAFGRRKEGNFHTVPVPRSAEIFGRDENIGHALAPDVAFRPHKCRAGALDGKHAAQALQAGCERPCAAAQGDDGPGAFQFMQRVENCAFGAAGDAETPQ